MFFNEFDQRACVTFSCARPSWPWLFSIRRSPSNFSAWLKSQISTWIRRSQPTFDPCTGRALHKCKFGRRVPYPTWRLEWLSLKLAHFLLVLTGTSREPGALPTFLPTFVFGWRAAHSRQPILVQHFEPTCLPNKVNQVF